MQNSARESGMSGRHDLRQGGKGTASQHRRSTSLKPIKNLGLPGADSFQELKGKLEHHDNRRVGALRSRIKTHSLNWEASFPQDRIKDEDADSTKEEEIPIFCKGGKKRLARVSWATTGNSIGGSTTSQLGTSF